MSKIIETSEINKIPRIGKIVLTGGCFDVLHPAHEKFLKLSKKQGDILVILLESDENIRKLKGNNRPLNNHITRAKNLSMLKEVDYVILLDMPNHPKYYYNLVKMVCPAIITVTSDDPLFEVKKRQAAAVGGNIIEVMDRDQKYSSTMLIK